MDRLPLEIRQMIADWTGAISKGSLQALCQVNREWNTIARLFLYQHIVIRLRNGEPPHVPYARSILTQTRQLSIVAEGRSNPHPKTDNDGQPREVQGTPNSFSRIPRILEGTYLGDEYIPRVCSYAGGDWTPIVDLIRRIPYLHELNLFVFKGGPVKLFEALSQYHPTCRVSIFTTLTLTRPFRGRPFTIHNVWLSSPMLYAVHFTCVDHDHSRVDMHPNRILQNIVLQAPHIREIALQIIEFRAVLAGRRLSNITLGPLAQSEEPPGPARIETISWPLNSKITATQFRNWQKITDFSVLKSWAVGCIEDSILLQTIVDIHPFQQLTRLTLALFPIEGPDFWRAADSMFNSLPPLTYLCLLGTYTPKFATDVVCSKHGLTLLELKLHRILTSSQWASRQIGPIFSTGDTLELAARCPSLQKLQICVQRHLLGLEAGMWSALGRFPSLTKLDLVLNCLPKMGANMMPVPPRNLTDFEKSFMVNNRDGIVCPRWFIRDCMINCAISERLAKAFFTHIRACQDSQRFIQLVIHLLYGQLDQYSCSTPGIVRRFIQGSFFDKLATTWTVKQDTLTGLHATCEEPFDPALFKDNPPDEMLSIFQSIPQELLA